MIFPFLPVLADTGRLDLREVVMTRQHSASRPRRVQHDDLNQLKRQAKDLLKLFRAGDAEAVAEVERLYRDANRSTFALHEAQLVVARRHGFESWAKLKHSVDRATVAKLAEAAKAGDVVRLRALLKSRPELVNMDLAETNEHRAIHYAVMHRQPEAVRVLMGAGADARKGIYPHRAATGALTLATERGFDEIVAIIEAEERHRREAMSCPNSTVSPVQDELNDAIRRRDDAEAIALLDSDPTLIKACDRDGGTPLHVAAGALNAKLVAWLAERGANVSKADLKGLLPMDRAVLAGDGARVDAVRTVVERLRGRGAALTARAAVALGDVDAVKAQSREATGTARGGIDWVRGGLLSIAVKYDQKAMIEALLDLGLDVNERTRVEGLEEEVISSGMPLWHAASTGKHDIAQVLLRRGADPNAQVYASGTPVYRAYGRRDERMIRLLEAHGGVADAPTAGLFRDVEMARRILAGEVRLDPSRETHAGQTLAEQLLWGAACGGSPQIVEMSLTQIDWPRDDQRWFHMLEQPLRSWSDGVPRPGRVDYLECFRLILSRANANVTGSFGRSLLHATIGSNAPKSLAERVAFARVLLDAGARLDVRDEIIRSTPLGWACRWGHLEMVRLLLKRGAAPVEPGAEAWTQPLAWARRMGHAEIVALLSN